MQPESKPQIPVAVVPPKVKHDWYQTDSHAVISIMLKNMKKENVSISIEENNVSFFYLQ